MKSTLILAAGLVAFSCAALAQSSPPQPIMPAPRVDANPNSNVQPLVNTTPPIYEGRAAAPMMSSAPRSAASGRRAR